MFESKIITNGLKLNHNEFTDKALRDYADKHDNVTYDEKSKSLIGVFDESILTDEQLKTLKNGNANFSTVGFSNFDKMGEDD